MVIVDLFSVSDCPSAETQVALEIKCEILDFGHTGEPRFNEVAGDRPNSFVKSRVRYIEVLFHIFYYYWGKEYRSLYRGFR